MNVRGPFLLHGECTSFSAPEPHQPDDPNILFQEKKMPLQYSFKQDYVLYADKVALSEAARDLRQRTLEEFHSIFSIVVKQKACYASSLLVRFFLRRVVEMYIVEQCYSKVCVEDCWQADHSESCRQLHQRRGCFPTQSDSHSSMRSIRGVL